MTTQAKPVTVVTMAIRLPADLKAKVEQLARDDDRTPTSYVAHLLRRHINQLNGHRPAELGR
ncbi:MAG TPA: hypothetical protein VHQ90_00160 [Thermoanaerobaculia bacterium]|nr:hypothetical protein [Thermoanaerobaculia bacterium]